MVADDGGRLALGRWLRDERQARCWDATQMGRRLAEAAGEGRSTLPGCRVLGHYVRRWEEGGATPTERYRLLYCAAFGIAACEFGPNGRTPALPSPEPLCLTITIQCPHGGGVHAVTVTPGSDVRVT